MKALIAERALIAESRDGERFDVALRIGTPSAGPHDSWVCVADIDGMPHRPLEAHGADSLQALLLAIQNLRSQLEHFVKGGGKLYLPGDEESGPMSVAEVFSDNSP